jgi:phosphohistidine phosphatase
MKTILLMRHAKSSWKHHDLADTDRPLAKRGEKDAPRIGHLIKDKDLTPQLILTSTALRSKRTAELVAGKSGYKGEITSLESFYLAEPPAYLEELRRLPDDLDRVLIIGHNPGLEGLVQILSGKVASLPTSALAHIKLPINSWNELDNTTQGELAHLWLPRDLK